MSLFYMKASPVLRALLGGRTGAVVAFLAALVVASSLTACTVADTADNNTTGNLQVETGEGGAVAGEEEDGAGGSPSENEMAVSFEIQGWEVISESDRAYLSVDFSCDTPVSVALADPNGVKTSYFQQIEEGESSVMLPMTSSTLVAPKPGTYSIIVHRWSGEPVATVELADFKGPDLTVTGVSFIDEENTVIVDVDNEGDLPAYVAYGDIWIEGSHPWVGGGQGSVSPGEEATLTISLYSTSLPPDTSAAEVEINLKDGAGNTIVSRQTFLFLVTVKTFANPSFNYAMTHPIDWTVTEESSSIESLVTVKSPSGGAWISIEVQKAPGYRLDQWVDDNNITRKNEWFSYEVLDNEQIDWKNLTAQEVRWVGQVSVTSEVIQGNEICISENGWKYSIRGISWQSAFLTYTSQLDAILENFALFP